VTLLPNKSELLQPHMSSNSLHSLFPYLSNHSLAHSDCHCRWAPGDSIKLQSATCAAAAGVVKPTPARSSSTKTGRKML
jgi:hypothetical protein